MKLSLNQKVMPSLAVLALTMSSAQAIITHQEPNLVGCAYVTCQYLLLTTSLPTMLIGGAQVDLNSAAATERLSAEAHQLADPVISTALAEKAGVSVEEIGAQVLLLESQGKDASAAAVIQSLSKN